MTNYVDGERIRHFVERQRLEVLSSTVSVAADSHLKSNFSLSTKATTAIVDWMNVPSKALSWIQVVGYSPKEQGTPREW